MYTDFNCSPQFLKKICNNNNIDLILCMDYQIQSYFAKHYKQEINSLEIPWLIPDYKASEIENKFYFNQWMKNNNFTQYIPADRKLCQYPYILKNGNGHSGKYVHIIHSKSDLEKINFDPISKPYICQEYINNSQEYVHHFIAKNGVCIKGQTFKQIFNNKKSHYIRGKDIYNDSVEKIELDSKHLEKMREIINNLRFTGIGCIDLKIQNNNLYLLEINSRMGGSLVFYYHITQDFDDFMQTLHSTITRNL